MGKTARNFVSDEDFIRIRDLKQGETVFCELRYGTVAYGANVYALEDRRFIIVNPVASRLCDRIREIYEEMSGYDVSISDDTLFGEALSRRLRTRSAASFVTERLRETLESRKIPFFDMARTVGPFVEELNTIGIKSRVSVFGEKDFDSVSAGSEGDFLLLLAVVVFLSDEDGGRVFFEVTYDNDRAYCRVTADGGVPLEDYESVRSENFEKRFEEAFGERRFWSRVAYLISNANLWDVSLEFIEGKTVFTVSTELTSHYTGCIFRDEENYNARRLIRLFFD